MAKLIDAGKILPIAAITIWFKYVLLCTLVSGCVHSVKISYPPESVIHPTFDKPYTIWKGEWVQVDWTPSLRAESFKYLATYDRVLLADSIRQRGLRDEYKIAGKGTPLVVYAKNPETTPEENHYPASGIALGITAVKEERRGQVPLLKLYDSFDPIVVRSSIGPDPIAANYTAPLAVIYSHARRVSGSATASFLRPIPAGHNLVSNPATVAEIKRILEENIVGRENFLGRTKTRGKKGATSPSESKAGY